MKTMQITEQQRSYIIAHLNDRPRTEVARKAGCSIYSVYRIVRQNGGKMLTERQRRNPRWEEIVREHYATMSGHEIERAFGITPNRANKIAQDLGLKHSPETEKRLLREAKERLAKVRKNTNYKDKARKWKTKRRLDQWRVWAGEPQQTKFRFSAMTKKAYKAKHYLMRTYGYVEHADNPYILLYNSETRRRLSGVKRNSNESYYSEVYHLQFKPEI